MNEKIADPTCSLHNGTECMDVYKCPYFSSLLQESPKNKLQIITELRRKQCGFVNRSPAVCCTKKDKVSTERTEHLIYNRNLDLLPIDTCGQHFFDYRITHGQVATLNELPWMALIIYNTEKGLDFLCGGTLISEIYVLTAAHCILDSISGVRLGEYDLLSVKDCDEPLHYCAPPVQDFHIDKIVMHQGFKNTKNNHDIALIRLSNPANISVENVQPICLPLERSELQGKLFTIAGWGTSENGYRNTVLHKASVPMIPTAVCQRLYQGLVNISENQMCAGGERADSCSGDSGGPLTSIISSKRMLKHVQYGIVSYGPKACGTLGLPGIYTKLENYVEWILDNLEP
ncbi:hypothetical protein WA026_021376 [Henosepilachna vigintioctopunctata]|uniref:CLIP domain-containing serine protease n=1 Tax=Henosepilachna vigintioctopunctata TaxID=420089 RepID=A0AAW1TXR3_9CUCU